MTRSDVVSWRAVALTTAFYFAALIALIAVTLAFDVKLTIGEGWGQMPSAWWMLLAATYYAVPFVVAAVVGYLHRPFLANFVAVVVAIFVLHTFYGAATSGIRQTYLDARQADIARGQAAVPGIADFGHRFVDDDDDGLVNRIVVAGRLDPDDLPAGDYQMFARFSQRGQPGPGLGDEEFTLAEEGPRMVALAFDIDARHLSEAAKAGPLTVDVLLNRRLTLGPGGRRILALCRWAAFFCPTSLLGYDPVLYDYIVEIARFDAVDTIALAPETIQRKQLVFLRFLGDRGRDIDGDGLFDALVISLELDSIYSGPIYFQAQIVGVANSVLEQTTSIGKGIVRLDFVIDGKRLRELAADGPYTLRPFVLLNNTSYCPGGTCVNENQPMFSLRLGPYTTGPYRAAQFE